MDGREEGVHRGNGSRYGRQGGLFTQELRAAWEALERGDVGALMINDVPIYRMDNMPFGGWKESGIGREGAQQGLEEYLETKFVAMDVG